MFRNVFLSETENVGRALLLGGFKSNPSELIGLLKSGRGLGNTVPYKFV